MRDLIQRSVQGPRDRILSAFNRRELDRVFREHLEPGQVPVVYIFTPELVHFAPFCIADTPEPFVPILIGNGVTPEDMDWLGNHFPDRPRVHLKASMTNNPKSMVHHANVLNDCLLTSKQAICFKDPDCFVTDSAFWSSVCPDETHYASGPFMKDGSVAGSRLPDTFCLVICPKTFAEVCERHGIDARVNSLISPSMSKCLTKAGFGETQFPDRTKAYFDTLQAYWVAAQASGLQFRHLDGADRTVFHIGGTSYLHRCAYELDHWDWWPLAVQYFNLRLLEHAALDRFRARFATLFAERKTADNLLREFPEFASGWRRQQYDSLLEFLLPYADGLATD